MKQITFNTNGSHRALTKAMWLLGNNAHSVAAGLGSKRRSVYGHVPADTNESELIEKLKKLGCTSIKIQ